METTMPDLNAPAQVFCVEMRTPSNQKYVAEPIYTGTVLECGRWMMSKEKDYPETYYMTVPLEAEFQKTQLGFNEVKKALFS
jgi:hypothetical protein